MKPAKKNRKPKNKLLIISCSLNSESRSRILAQRALAAASEKQDVELVDLRDYTLPHCDGDGSSSHRDALKLARKIKSASCILLSVPVYNYSVSAAAKNLIELTGDAFTDKVVGFLCAAGGMRSFMSVLPMANSMMLDFGCIITPRFVYADKSAFTNNQLTSDEIAKRIDDLVSTATRLSKKLLG